MTSPTFMIYALAAFPILPTLILYLILRSQNARGWSRTFRNNVFFYLCSSELLFIPLSMLSQAINLVVNEPSPAYVDATQVYALAAFPILPTLIFYLILRSQNARGWSRTFRNNVFFYLCSSELLFIPLSMLSQAINLVVNEPSPAYVDATQVNVHKSPASVFQIGDYPFGTCSALQQASDRAVSYSYRTVIGRFLIIHLGKHFGILLSFCVCLVCWTINGVLWSSLNRQRTTSVRIPRTALLRSSGQAMAKGQSSTSIAYRIMERSEGERILPRWRSMEAFGCEDGLHRMLLPSIRDSFTLLRNLVSLASYALLRKIYSFTVGNSYPSASDGMMLLKEGHVSRKTFPGVQADRWEYIDSPANREELGCILSMSSERRYQLVKSSVERENAENSIWTNTVQFSSRFSAVWAHFEEIGTIWVCIMDEECSVFALRANSSVVRGELEKVALPFQDRTCVIDRLNLPDGPVNWSTLLQSAADFQDSHNAIRAVQISCIVCTQSQGGNSCVPYTLVLRKTQTLPTHVYYDIPVDFDLMTALADPLRIEGQLYFRCGFGTIAKVVDEKKAVCHLEHVEGRIANLEAAESVDKEKHGIPFLYGYGRFLNSDIPCTTTKVSKILEKIPFGGISELLLAVKKTEAPDIEADGKLDLPAAASVIFATEGCFLGSPSLGSRSLGSRIANGIRKITGDVLLVGKDGIYKTSRFDGMAVEGSLEVNLILVKVGMKAGRAPNKDKDTRVEKLSVIAEHILCREYSKKYRHPFPDHVVLGPDNLWADEVAVCNTLVALLCRKFGHFNGFSKVTGTPSSVYRNTNAEMDADIFLPWLSVWEHPRIFLISSIPRHLKVLFYRAVFHTFPEDKIVFFWSKFWNQIIQSWSYLSQCPEKFVRNFIMELKQTSVHPESKIFVLGRKILTCWSPNCVHSNETIRVAAKV